MSLFDLILFTNNSNVTDAVVNFGDRSVCQIWNGIMGALTALGTCGAVIYAVCKDSFRRKPKLVVETGFKEPYLKILKDDSVAGGTGKIKRGDVYIVVRNLKRTTAENVCVYLDKIFLPTGKTLFESVKSFVPRNFVWAAKADSVAVPGKTCRQLKIAEVALEKSEGKAPEAKGDGFLLKSIVAIWFSSAGETHVCENRDHMILQIHVHSSNGSMCECFMKINWTGKSLKDLTNEEKFSVENITRSQMKRLTKEEF